MTSVLATPEAGANAMPITPLLALVEVDASISLPLDKTSGAPTFHVWLVPSRPCWMLSCQLPRPISGIMGAIFAAKVLISPRGFRVRNPVS